ncbi:hypothetical protein [Kosmotoga pacifica]|uniref:hypothetical protein n=1 Tax=Kosmotoga pacifica TaxID=1330330 RepID=UPI0012E0A332|nr:hypothetical protein [Kosmotoga pacifica]
MIAFSSVYEAIMPPRINTNCSGIVTLHKRKNYAQLSTHSIINLERAFAIAVFLKIAYCTVDYQPVFKYRRYWKHREHFKQSSKAY